MSRGSAAALGALLATVVAVFAYTVSLRAPWFAHASDRHHFWLTAHTLTVLENWYEEGALASRFAMLDHPASVEHRTLADRKPYVSYPVGFLLPLHAVTLLTGERPSLALIMGFNLFNHLVMALLLAALGFAIARASEVPPAVSGLFGAIPAAVVLLMPGPLYWMQNVFFTDQAVMVPFALAVCLEWMRDGESPRTRRVASVLLPAVLFWAAFVDYLGVFIALAIFGKRWLAGEYALRPFVRLWPAVRFWLPVAAALGLFALHVALLDGYALLHERAVLRTGGSREGEWAGAFRWLEYLRQQYGWPAVASFAVGVVGCAALALDVRSVRHVDRSAAGRRRIARLVGAAAVAILPCVAQVVALRNHSVMHDFSALKFVVPLALVPWVLVPLALAERMGWTPAAARERDAAGLSHAYAVRRTLTVAAASVAIAIGSVAIVQPRRTIGFRDDGVAWGQAAAFLRQHTDRADVVFSPDWEIERRPPQLLAIARKRVYRVADPADFRARARALTARIDEPYRVDLVFLEAPPPKWEPVVAGIAPIRAGTVSLYKDVPIGSDRHTQ